MPAHNYFRRLEICLRFAFINKRRRHNDENNEINVLAYFEANPSNSIRRAAVECGVSTGTVHKILKKKKYKPYKLNKVQHLQPGDYDRRLEFCHLLLNEGADMLKKLFGLMRLNSRIMPCTM